MTPGPPVRAQLAPSALAVPEVWAGFECTVRRAGDSYLDQIVLTGHENRLDDLDLVASLGVRTVRYPVLWTRTAPDPTKVSDWSWPDARLGRLRELGIEPIVGLVHHGSGPPHTSLLHDSFADGLAHFAGEVARRYDWVRHFTPVNEPLTTARFSGLYGHWYPHGRDETTFIRALVIQCRATVLAMRAIRAVTPDAALIQTEDVGKVYATPALAYQADFENERRWLSFDLLCGRVDRDHPLWGYLRWAGVPERDVAWFAENPCPPDVFGINHYLSGERFLDERLERYPEAAHGGNGRHRYADVLAARVCAAGPAGPAVILREAWARYGRPIAVTEVHNGCTREDQLRWLHEVWKAAVTLRSEGADVRAVTVWSLLGAYDWNSLLTQERGSYETGVFDLATPRPRPTALASMVRDLAAGREHAHPVLAEPGWWRRPERLWHEPSAVATGGLGDVPSERRGRGRPILITGGERGLARAVARSCIARGMPYRIFTSAELDITRPEEVTRLLGTTRAWAVVNATSYGGVDDAEGDPDSCFRSEAEGPGVLAAACAERGTAFVTFSSGLVFDGARIDPYLERHPSAPLSVYGRAKAEAERLVLMHLPAALVVRTSFLFGHGDAADPATRALRALARAEEVWAPTDLVVSPTFVADLVEATLDLLVDGERGVWHLSNGGEASWCEFARLSAEHGGWDRAVIVPCLQAELAFSAPRPRYSVLGSERGAMLPPLDEAIRRCVRT
ncbi:MAG: sugar nucleotide-binding protein [Trueperaceae bacterium]|nr:sugar nucleotide-binding protein [Trueperaceae bacterium]